MTSLIDNSNHQFDLNNNNSEKAVEKKSDLNVHEKPRVDVKQQVNTLKKIACVVLLIFSAVLSPIGLVGGAAIGAFAPDALNKSFTFLKKIWQHEGYFGKTAIITGGLVLGVFFGSTIASTAMSSYATGKLIYPNR